MEHSVEIELLSENELQALAITLDLLNLYPSATDDCQNNLLGSLWQLFDLLSHDLGSGRWSGG